MLYSRSLLVTYFIYSGVYILIPTPNLSLPYFTCFFSQLDVHFHIFVDYFNQNEQLKGKDFEESWRKNLFNQHTALLMPGFLSSLAEKFCKVKMLWHFLCQKEVRRDGNRSWNIRKQIRKLERRKLVYWCLLGKRKGVLGDLTLKLADRKLFACYLIFNCISFPLIN